MVIYHLIKNLVVKRFEEAGYQNETYVSYCIIGGLINIVEIEGEQYFTLTKKYDL